MRAVRIGQTHHDLGWWGYVFGFTYHQWQGRWASCGIEAAVLPHVDMTRHYPPLVAAVAAANAACLYVVVRGLTRAGLPSLAEAVYWFVGAVENPLPIAAAAVVVTLLATTRAAARLRPVTTALLAAAAFAISGLHELYGSMFCLTLLVGAAAAHRAGSDRRNAWVTVAIAAAAGLAVVVLAPGNHVRLAQDVHPQGRGPARVLLLAARQLWAAGRFWVLDPKVIAATLWVAVSPRLEAARAPWPSADRVPWRWVIPLTWATLVLVGFAVPSWAFAAEMPPRTLAGNYVVLVGGWLLSVYVWTRPLASPPRRPPPAWRPLRAPAVADAAALLPAASLLVTGNLFSAAEDLAHRLRPWHAAADRRFATRRRAAGTDAVVPRLPAEPYLVLDGDVVDDPAHWKNRGPVAYFRLHTLRLAPPPATAPSPVPVAPRPPPG